MQASRFEGLSFDPFPLLQDGFVTAEVDVRRCDVIKALVVALMIVLIDNRATYPNGDGQTVS